MRNIKPQAFIWSICLLIIALICILLGYLTLALIFTLFALFGSLLKFLLSKQEINMFSKKWINLYITIIVLVVIVRSLITGWKWRHIDVILFIIVVGLIYLWFRFLNKKCMIN